MPKTIPQLVRGYEILRDWLGAGAEPVAAIHAEARAEICSTCPHNIRGNWMDRLKGQAANMILSHLEFKNQQGLQLSCEDKIGFCEKCGCCLSLKCWVPTEHVMAHTPQNELLEFPDFCWVRRELTAG